jgi:hypothetical protein
VRDNASLIPFFELNVYGGPKCKKWLVVTVLLAFPAASLWPTTGAKNRHQAPDTKEEIARSQKIELWRPPSNIHSRNLFWGPGGKRHAPHTTYTYIKEDLDGTTPKLHVRDENGFKWRIKLGLEARPETAASRLIWAVGYSTNQFYFAHQLRVEGLPAHLHRGQNLISPDGSLRNVELKRYPKNEKKVGNWHWRHNPFRGTREMNGLRVMMALVNNWDLKDQNNAVYEVQHASRAEEVYRVSDLGDSLGTTGRSWTHAMTKDNLSAYVHSQFIHKVKSDFVDFNVPTRPALICIFDPPEFIMRLRQRWVGRHIPRKDVRWVAGLLSQLSDDQIGDAFRAAGYSPAEVQALSQALEKRIHELNDL